MLHRVAFLRTDVSEERRASIINVTLMMEALIYSETLFLTRARWRNISEYGIFYCHRSEYLKSHNV
jgi:hypothetical protein